MTIRVLLPLLAAAALLHADTLILHNGSRVDGTFIDAANHAVRFAVGNQINTYSLSDIDSIRFATGSAADALPPASPPAPAQAPANPAPNQPPAAAAPSSSAAAAAASARSASADAPAPAAGSSALQVPAGTEIVVRLIDDVNSERDNPGETYRASVDQSVVVNGQTAIPRGADVMVALIDAQKSGKIEGKTVLTLDIRKLTVNGRDYDVRTTGVPEASSSRGARSAKVIGGAAALGAIIGAAAGGGKGAAIGAGSGAAVGTAAQVATSGQKVKVPAETRLTFTLQSPIDL